MRASRSMRCVDVNVLVCAHRPESPDHDARQAMDRTSPARTRAARHLQHRRQRVPANRHQRPHLQGPHDARQCPRESGRAVRVAGCGSSRSGRASSAVVHRAVHVGASDGQSGAGLLSCCVGHRARSDLGDLRPWFRPVSRSSPRAPGRGVTRAALGGSDGICAEDLCAPSPRCSRRWPTTASQPPGPRGTTAAVAPNN